MAHKVLTVDGATLASMDTNELKNFLTMSAKQIDYLGYCRRLVEANPQKWNKLSSCLLIIKDMGITKMNITDFNSMFLRKFKEYLDNTPVPITKNKVMVGHKHYSQNSKRLYLYTVCQVFRMMQRDYNTEFNTVISHNPFIGLEHYQTGITAKRSMTVEQVRAFFNMQVKSKSQQATVDLMKLSFCLCGINLMDIFAMEKSAFDEKSMRITYERHKTRDRTLTHSLTSVHVEPEIYDIINKYRAPYDSKMLFSFKHYVADYNSTRKAYLSLRHLCKIYEIDPITPYWFRHTWATIARNECDISKDDIDLCLAHSGHNPMADVYIRPDWSRIDRANRKVLDCVFGSEQK
jgi:integrase